MPLGALCSRNGYLHQLTQVLPAALTIGQIIEKYLREGAVVCKAVPFAVNFFWHELVLPYMGKHSNPVKGFVDGVEICLH
jgi:hypothetical protein